MSNASVLDGLPVVSQVKSLVELAGGDVEGARRTQVRFSEACPLVSQVTSIVYACSGERDRALEVQKEFFCGCVQRVKVPKDSVLAGEEGRTPFPGEAVGTAQLCPPDHPWYSCRLLYENGSDTEPDVDGELESGATSSKGGWEKDSEGDSTPKPRRRPGRTRSTRQRESARLRHLQSFLPRYPCREMLHETTLSDSCNQSNQAEIPLHQGESREGLLVSSSSSSAQRWQKGGSAWWGYASKKAKTKELEDREGERKGGTGSASASTLPPSHIEGVNSGISLDGREKNVSSQSSSNAPPPEHEHQHQHPQQPGLVCLRESLQRSRSATVMSDKPEPEAEVGDG
uniref:Uncharacterized protein n=1 Tax=Chromera velia CCMP2878 TaxID=1169474 RepID=A0A0G4GCV8_9ALVE|mmetsp:Transcript_37031/g.72832  ORF Transcript_37031/g.72832 Transcript_37031/m.72832 type:complete len:343 (+) Transcript_37031:166-1194(+)|eukprot:Cvel_21337.t1-p1 / transcript=Cvel_21337.t1 / gene=Cvel_21337 / organism=Chromera_velia_CCMP2878 / gene_product=hypothetical protein / transcript_product=hypothetical protein / location=Cvel_scaffold1991:661-2224(+) / protein_length=342 / sequence_SO=supercontig / SO=protein_coding / is_pseudo=false